MEQLIKITSIPMQTVRLTQSARLVSSGSADIERRKAIARQISFQRTHSSNPTVSVDAISRINRAFSRRNAAPQAQTVSKQQVMAKQQQSIPRQQQPVITQSSSSSVSMNPASSLYSGMTTATIGSSVNMVPADLVSSAAYEAAPVSLPGSGASSYEFTSSYTAQRGALEMRVAKGELTFLPPMVMTIVTQRPELRFEYLGDFNYVPPRKPNGGANINLST